MKRLLSIFLFLLVGTGLSFSNFSQSSNYLPTMQKGETEGNATQVGGKTVLGKFPDYLKLADEIGAKKFSIPTEIWNKMSPAEQWAANQKFLDRAILRGDDILLSNPVKNINDVSGAFRQELDYLINKGYKLNFDGTKMLK